MGYSAPTHESMVDAILCFALMTVDHACVREICAISALMSIFIDSLSVHHGARDQIILHRVEILEFLSQNSQCLLYLDPVSLFNHIPSIECLCNFLSTVIVKFNRIQMNNVLNKDPFKRKNRYFLPCQSVDILSFRPKGQP